MYNWVFFFKIILFKPQTEAKIYVKMCAFDLWQWWGNVLGDVRNIHILSIQFYMESSTANVLKPTQNPYIENSEFVIASKDKRFDTVLHFRRTMSLFSFVEYEGLIPVTQGCLALPWTPSESCLLVTVQYTCSKSAVKNRLQLLHL